MHTSARRNQLAGTGATGEETMTRLKSFEEARRRAGAWNRRPEYVAPIEVRRVVGSVDEVKRATLTSRFLPRRGGTQAPRYRDVLAAMRAGRALPAIEVYALGEEYYVVDGHHRVAAARALGQLYLDALVHEYLLPVGQACRCRGVGPAGSATPAAGPRRDPVGPWPVILHPSWPAAVSLWAGWWPWEDGGSSRAHLRCDTAA